MAGMVVVYDLLRKRPPKIRRATVIKVNPIRLAVSWLVVVIGYTPSL
jgi:hypothetical protein